MDRRRFLATLGATVALGAGPAMARSKGEAVIERIREQLARQGYERIDVERTLLGRVRIMADGPKARREIIVDPRTGEILRDLWQVLDPGDGMTGGDPLLDGDDGGSGGHDDKDDDKDSSGHDSGSSGSGGHGDDG